MRIVQARKSLEAPYSGPFQVSIDRVKSAVTSQSKPAKILTQLKNQKKTKTPNPILSESTTKLKTRSCRKVTFPSKLCDYI